MFAFGSSFIKICGVTNLEDARGAYEAGADAIGFILTPSPRQITPQAAADIVQELPADVLCVGVVRNETQAEIEQLITKAKVGAVQLHGRPQADLVLQCRQFSDVVFAAFTLEEAKSNSLKQFQCDAVLLDSPAPGSGTTFAWDEATEIAQQVRTIVAGGLNPNNVAEAIAIVRPFGVDVASGVERSAGVKDHEAVKMFCQIARSALQELSKSPNGA